MRFMLSTAWTICRLPSACSLVAIFTWPAILFMFSTASRTWRPPAACSFVEYAAWVMIRLMFSMAWRICFVPRPRLDLPDDLADLLGRLHRALRELAHLVGDDGEAAAGLSRAGGFDGGVEREQVGLIGDLLDHLQDLADLLRAAAQAGDDPGRVLHGLGDRAHAGDRASDRLVSGARVVGGAAADAVGLLGDLGHVADRRRHLRDRVGRLLGGLAQRL